MSEIQNAINLNRLNLGENSIQNIQRMNDSLKSSKSNSTFEEALQKEVNEPVLTVDTLNCIPVFFHNHFSFQRQLGCHFSGVHTPFIG